MTFLFAILLAPRRSVPDIVLASGSAG